MARTKSRAQSQNTGPAPIHSEKQHPSTLEVESKPLHEILPYARNARKIPSAAIEKVAASLREYGWRQPMVVDPQGVLVVGHVRRLAALHLGWTHGPVHVATDLSPQQIAAYRLMDNRSGEETDWDRNLLSLELFDLKTFDFDLSLTGFDDLEIGQLLPTSSKGLTDDEDVPQPPDNPISRIGDVWLLGKHRLVCGDATVTKDVESLMNGQMADMVFTDPPYNVGYDAEARKSYFSPERLAHKLGTIKGDAAKTPAVFRAFLDKTYSNITRVLNSGRAIYICHADTEGHHFRQAFVDQPWTMQSCIIWKKSVLCFGRADYHWMHEPILYGWKDGASHLWAGDRKQTTVWEIKTDHYNKSASDTGGKYVHPTQKPVALIEQSIHNSSREGDIVLDLFGGSGSTLIAAHKTDRLARILELDPKYCDVIIERWQNYTGSDAKLFAADEPTFSELQKEASEEPEVALESIQ